jgi:hypothetical protein
MRLRIHPMLNGSTRTTRRHPRRAYMNMSDNIPVEVYGGGISGAGVSKASHGDPVKRATEKLKHLSIKKSKPLKKYISFE